MKIFAISGLINLIVILYISVFVFIKSRKNLANKIFVLLTLATALWSFGYWRWLSEDVSYENALFWVRILSIGSTWIPILLLQWISVQYRDYVIKRLNRYILFFYYILGLIFTLFNFSPLFVKGVEEKLFFLFWPNPGILYIFYVIFCYICLSLYTVFVLTRAYRNSIGQIKNQIKYVSIGTFIALTGGFFNFPLWYDIPIPPYGNFFVSIYPIIFTYAIIKYRLMDIRFVISRSILYFILVLIVALSFTFVTFSTGQLLGGKGRVLITLVVSLIIVIFLDPLKRLLAKWTDKFFYKGRIDYQKVLRNIGEIVARELDLQKLTKLVEENLAKEIKVKFVKVYLRMGNKGEAVFSRADKQEQFSKDDLVLQYLSEKKEMIITEELIRQKTDLKSEEEKGEIDKLQDRLDQKETGLVVPIMTEDKITAVFCIGQKLSGSPFIQEEINFFDILAPQVATALEKSKLFEEVQASKVNLEHLVAQRTRDLQERNRYLIALQTLINLITRSLDFQKVMQTIADGISKELGYIGGILNFIDEKEKTIHIGAISNTPQIQKVIKFVPKDPREYHVSLEEKENLAVQAVNNKEITHGDKMHDFFTPAIPTELSDKIQKALGTKSVLAVPVYTEEKVIGVIDFVLAKPVEAVTEVEKEMMKSLADQVGIVYRNLILYQQIQRANVELKEANIRLQQLDRVKSDFLSIASHQLRTPLTCIKGYLSMMLEGDYGQVPANLKTILEELSENTDRLTRLVNVFLNVSRIESGRFELELKEVDFVKLIEEVIAELKLTADKKNLKINFKEPKKILPHILLDRDKIKDVLVNLVDNSIKYTLKGKVDIFLETKKDQIKVTVKDTGVGVKKDEVKNLFKKFVRGEGITQIHTGGSGLGLYIVRKIIEAHGGEVWVESEGKDKGATFVFTLPVK